MRKCVTRDSDWAVFCPRHQSWILESSVFQLMEVKEELSSVPGISELSGRKVQWGVMKNFEGLLVDMDCMTPLLGDFNTSVSVGLGRGLGSSFLTWLLFLVLSSLLFPLI